MTLWEILSYVPGTSPYRTYRGCVKYIDDITAHLQMRYPNLTSDLVPLWLRRDPNVCKFAVETFTALLDAVDGVDRGLTLGECEALFDEHRPLPEHIR